ncbi:aminoglycoside phosphotransferase family protein [Candidatus Poribacteria bacterium]|nr:aminoglycoside phosphotransferase family protein [Candidatus Poribacteria bacterium]MBT5533574.1 aminoglycoside phosphotransferase family protein [Candidatus Poribacteria bacterium]MBT5709642.1 aminoglycoside phosphotransferase family protein [Candidatus Poribacteria bacterium]MBT7095971.1 aminoglycoside phosphotransferase family protein [Candidatus Poribacteria bacterium]MBT7809042.1 aminoglycoside phosphotransferase family protein [Candidatus Poribacteria bacterium]
MNVPSLPTRIDAELLRPLVRAATSLPQAEVADWRSRTIDDGTVGHIYVLDGTARDSPSDARTTEWSLVLKIQRQWARPGDPECWRREFLMYESGLLDEVADVLAVPKLYRADTHDDETWLWLERVHGVSGADMTVDHYRCAARDLGRMQGSYLAGREIPAYAWLSSRRWASTAVRLWGTPAVHGLWNSSEGRETAGLPRELSRATLRLWERRDALLDSVDATPRTLSHRDYHADNLFMRPDAADGPATIALDWDCAGVGTLAEDIGDMVAEALVYFGHPPEDAEGLADAAIKAYASGLRDAGWAGDIDVVRTAFATILPLQWCMRVARLAQTNDSALLPRYIAVQRYMLGLAEGVRA